jgi:hypothetical protein
MRHLIGGWALGTLIGGTVLAIKATAGTKIFDCYLWAAFVIGPLAALAAWGLL